MPINRTGQINPALIAAIVLVLAGLAAAAWYFMREEPIPGDIKVLVDGKEVDPKTVLKEGKIQLQGGGEWNAKHASIDPQDHMRKLVGGYFALPAGPQRQKYLDEMIDQQEKARKEMGITSNPDGTPNIKVNGQAGPASQPGQKQTIVMRTGGAGMMDSISPDLRTQMAEYAAAINKRRAERGLPAQQGMMFIRTKQN